jgi:hypothetical protein
MAQELPDAAALWKLKIASNTVPVDARGNRQAISIDRKNYPARRSADR